MLVIGSAQAADPLRVRLDWTPWGNQAPFHLAQKLGLFAKHGLDVRLEDGNGSVSTVQIVGNGEYDVGHASLASMAIARSKGLPVRAFANFIRQNDIGLLVDKGSGISKPADLKGKKLAFTAGSLETPFLDRFLAEGGLKRTDVELVNVDAAASPFCEVTNSPTIAPTRASDIATFRPAKTCGRAQKSLMRISTRTREPLSTRARSIVSGGTERSPSTVSITTAKTAIRKEIAIFGSAM